MNNDETELHIVKWAIEQNTLCTQQSYLEISTPSFHQYGSFISWAPWLIIDYFIPFVMTFQAPHLYLQVRVDLIIERGEKCNLFIMLFKYAEGQ